MNEEIGKAIHAALYLLLFSGAMLIFAEDFRTLFLRMKMRRRLHMRTKRREAGRLTRHLDLMMKTVSAGRFDRRAFTAVSLLLFAAVTVTGLRSYAPQTAAFFGLLIGLMPYILCRIRLENFRHRASFEGERFAAALLSKYRMVSLNMREALELLAADEKTPPLCRRLLAQVLLGAQKSGEREKISAFFRTFEFGVHTNWSRMAAYNMALSYATGMDVSDALEDLVVQLREARVLSEERKRMNAEAGRLVTIMVPVSYAVSMLLAVKYVNVNAGKLLHNQFFTPQGFAFFVLIVFLFFVNLALLKIVENRRFDY